MDSRITLFFRRNPRLLGFVMALFGGVALFALPMEARSGGSINIWVVLFSPIMFLLGLLVFLAPRKCWLMEEAGPVLSPQLKRIGLILFWIGVVIGVYLVFGYYKINPLTNTYHTGNDNH